MCKIIPLAVPNLVGNEAKYLQKCIETTFVSSVGEFVTEFEKMVREASDANACVVTSAGTTALHLALMGVGVQRDDLVIVPSFTFIATANAVAHCGALPWSIDIDPNTWTMDPNVLNSTLEYETERRCDGVYHKKTGHRISAIMPVYTLGMPADMEKINAIAKQYKLPVVADAACALGARYHGKNLCELADLTVFSFNGNKTITCGGGGAVVGNDKELIERLRHISTTARISPEYDHDMVGYNYRMTNIQAAVGCAQMERLTEFVSAKGKIRKYYSVVLKDIPEISFFPEVSDVISAYWFSGIVLSENCKFTARQVCEKLKEMGVEARTFWKPIYLQKPYIDAPKSEQTIADNLWERIITLPCSTGITDQELEQVCVAVKKLF